MNALKVTKHLKNPELSIQIAHWEAGSEHVMETRRHMRSSMLPVYPYHFLSNMTNIHEIRYEYYV